MVDKGNGEFLYPIDFSKLSRGDKIGIKELEKAFGFKEGTPEYAFKSMGLKIQIQAYFMRDRGDLPSIEFDHGVLCVLTHEEQDAYVQRQLSASVRKFSRAHREDQYTDESYLSASNREKRRQRLATNGWKLLMLKKKKPPALADEQKKLTERKG